MSVEQAGARADIFKELNPRQREAVEYDGGPLLIIAGAGTGKTKTITCKIARLISAGVPPWRILALTFTNKAAKQMRDRVEIMLPGQAAKVWAYTFHSFCARILRQHAKALNITPDFLIYDESDQKKVIHSVLEDMCMEDEKPKAGIYLNIISRAKDDLLDAQSYSIHSHASGAQYRVPVSQIYLKYQAKLAQAGALDFGDLLIKSAELLREKQDVREYFQDYFKHILVDEYQDTNHAQYVITKTLSAKHRSLCVVGDPDQSIYSWRGADIRNIMEFERDFPDAKIITLEENYRSTANILSCADNVIKNNKRRKPKTLYTSKPSGSQVHLEELATETEEAKWVARAVQELVNNDGLSLNEIAVF
ncbi:MAG: UvrD-helicase domain-containing protein, partial [Elusimicrobia bacterium]|nr:UvrD-helicase domain-containing protein [Elusimicrobiota bacterium]